MDREQRAQNDFMKLTFLLQHTMPEEFKLIETVKARKELIDELPDSAITCEPDERAKLCQEACRTVLKRYLFPEGKSINPSK